jgi:hypothetical protein
MECTNSATGRIPTLVYLTNGVRSILATKVKWAYTCLYKKQYHIPRGILGIVPPLVRQRIKCYDFDHIPIQLAYCMIRKILARKFGGEILEWA